MPDNKREPPWCIFCGQRHPSNSLCDPERIEWLTKRRTQLNDRVVWLAERRAALNAMTRLSEEMGLYE